MKELGCLVGGSLLVWGLLVIPARHLWGEAALVHSLAALGLCVLPAGGALMLDRWTLKGDPGRQLLGILIGTVIRLIAVSSGALILYLRVAPFQNQEAFLVWLLVFYLFTLALETTLVVRRRVSTPQP